MYFIYKIQYTNKIHIMDLIQRKLTKSEWNNTEVSVSSDEMEILKLIMEGYNDTDYIYNKHTSLILFLKMSINVNDDALIAHLYNIFFKERISIICEKYNINKPVVSSKIKKVNNGEAIRIAHSKAGLHTYEDKIFEYCLIKMVEHIAIADKKNSIQNLMYYYYSIKFLMKTKIRLINIYVIELINNVLLKYEDSVNIIDIIKQSHRLLEENEFLNNYKDYTLYNHQKNLFSFCKQHTATPKLITYVAPTGTGKTLSPIGLSSSHKVIFVCAARHVGLALAKSAISIGKKIAFAFGCNDVSDIRLHYFAAKEYSKNRRSGGIAKVDNSVGDKVEIMITDIKSYICAMHYMASFTEDLQEIITYWDEPTITMDQQENDNHKYIHDNWSKNIIPNMILSSATLPPKELIYPIIQDFCGKFPDAISYEIISQDCNKSIPIINKEGFIEMPHFICSDYEKLQSCVSNCRQYRTLFRYFDLNEIIKFLFYIRDNNYIEIDELNMENYFSDIYDVTMNSLKEYYLQILETINSDHWETIYQFVVNDRHIKYKGSVYLTTSDAHTLVDGPAIYLTDDVMKVSMFMLQNANIPASIVNRLAKNIEFNNRLSKKIVDKENLLEDMIGTEVEKERKMDNMRITPEQKKLKSEIDTLHGQIQSIEMNELYIPNTDHHLNKWAKKSHRTNEMMPIIDPVIVERIMTLEMEDSWKVLLLMGIGVMTNHGNIEYNEIMKSLADNQKLYLILATSDYIYGTNYQFCHGFIGKDLEYITQEKTIQAMGRIGRNQISKTYSIRLRDNSFLSKIFFPQDYSLEAQNMVRLFETDD